MLSRLIAMVSMAAFLSAQMPLAFSGSAGQILIAQTSPAQTLPAQPAAQNASPAATQTVTVPAGTAIPLTLINPIRSKTSRPGDAVRAAVAFPVTVGTQVAIPAGSYAEGALEQVTARAGSTGQPEVKIHFTRLLFANGYSVALDAENTQAELGVPVTSATETSADASAADAETHGDASVTEAAPQPHLVRASYALEGQEQSTAPSAPQVGPSPAVVGGAMAGATAAFLIGILVWAHHRANNTDYLLFDSGWQFQIVLQNPLKIDTARAAAPVAAAN